MERGLETPHLSLPHHPIKPTNHEQLLPKVTKILSLG